MVAIATQLQKVRLEHNDACRVYSHELLVDRMDASKQLLPKVFISYAHEDVDRDALDFFRITLEKNMKAGIEIVFDQNVPIGFSFNTFMDGLGVADVAIVVMTPAYARKCLEKSGSVWKEYRIIIERLDSPTFKAFPVLLSGSRKQSTPTRLESLNCLDLSRLIVRREKNGEFKFPAGNDPIDFGDKICSLAKQITDKFIVQSPEFITRSKEYKRVFLDLKASWNLPGNASNNDFRRLFVKTISFDLIDRQNTCYVVGRSGSGKSTITQMLPILNHERFFDYLRINADNYNLKNLYSRYHFNDNLAGVETLFPRFRAFEMTWEAVLLFAVLQTIAKNWTGKVEIRGIHNFISNATKQHSDGLADQTYQLESSDVFTFCFQKLIDFVSICSKQAREEEAFYALDVKRLCNLETFLEFVFGSDVLCCVRDVIRTLHSKKFLVSLDGFDDAFEEFRREAIRQDDHQLMRSYVQFEGDWLRSLLSFTLRAKRHEDNYLYSCLDFCIAVPLDRFLEVARTNRDSHRVIGQWNSLHWSGIELSILLRKRLEYFLSPSQWASKRLSPSDRLNEVLRNVAFQHLPASINFEFNGSIISMPLFMYVLRHTFWRPREVLIYYARLLTMADMRKRWEENIDDISIRKWIKNTTQEVIQSEFINELQTSILNIEEIVNAFTGARIILTWLQLRKIVDSLEFMFVAGLKDQPSLIEKVKYLYEVGFLGLSLSKLQAESLGACSKHAFIFNEGRLVFARRTLNETELKAYKYVIHPVFCERLSLKTSKTSFTLVFDWEYLYSAEEALRLRMHPLG